MGWALQGGGEQADQSKGISVIETREQTAGVLHGLESTGMERCKEMQVSCHETSEKCLFSPGGREGSIHGVSSTARSTQQCRNTAQRGLFAEELGGGGKSNLLSRLPATASFSHEDCKPMPSPQMPAVSVGDYSSQAITLKKKREQPSLLLYYIAQYIITMLGNCITFKCVLCTVYYGGKQSLPNPSSDSWWCILDIQQQQEFWMGWEYNIQAAADSTAIALKGEQWYSGLSFAI